MGTYLGCEASPNTLRVGRTAMPLSTVQRAKRALVTLLLALARAYGVDTAVSRESADADFRKAFQIPADGVVPLWGGLSEGGFAIVTFHQKRNFTVSER